MLVSWQTFTLGASGALGLVIGSFVNVVVARLPYDQSLVRPRSRCPQCEKPIAWYDNLPVVSYLALRGRCRHCRAPISIRYPVIELLTGLLFMAGTARWEWGWTLWIRDWPFLASLVAIAFIDLEHRIIPDELSIGGTFWGLATAAAFGFLSWESGRPIAFLPSLAGAALGFGVFFVFGWLYERLTGRMGLGGGDVKLLAMLGAFLGPAGVFCAILISSVFGSIVGIGWGLARKEKSLRTLSIPYGPFLVIGGLYYYLFGENLWLRFMTPT